MLFTQTKARQTEFWTLQILSKLFKGKIIELFKYRKVENNVQTPRRQNCKNTERRNEFC